MSLGGIAVAIGAMVDASIIVVENVHKRLERWETGGRAEPRRAVVVAAMQEVGPSLFFSLLVITVSFLPVFTLQGVEGRLFRPLAFTKTYSMGFAAVLAVTLTPALVALVIRGRIRREEASPVNRWLIRAYTPVVRFVVRWRWAVVGVAVLAMVATVPAFALADAAVVVDVDRAPGEAVGEEAGHEERPVADAAQADALLVAAALERPHPAQPQRLLVVDVVGSGVDAHVLTEQIDEIDLGAVASAHVLPRQRRLDEFLEVLRWRVLVDNWMIRHRSSSRPCRLRLQLAFPSECANLPLVPQGIDHFVFPPVPFYRHLVTAVQYVLAEYNAAKFRAPHNPVGRRRFL
jgi:hypothetical protein